MSYEAKEIFTLLATHNSLLRFVGLINLKFL